MHLTISPAGAARRRAGEAASQQGLASFRQPAPPRASKHARRYLKLCEKRSGKRSTVVVPASGVPELVVRPPDSLPCISLPGAFRRCILMCEWCSAALMLRRLRELPQLPHEAPHSQRATRRKALMGLSREFSQNCVRALSGSTSRTSSEPPARLHRKFSRTSRRRPRARPASNAR